MSSKKEQAEKTVTVIIKTSRGSDTFTFEKTDTVVEAISEARDRFDLSGDGDFTLVREGNGDELSPEQRPLVSFDLPDEAELVLTGGGTNV